MATSKEEGWKAQALGQSILSGQAGVQIGKMGSAEMRIQGVSMINRLI